jgi:hypothetical protein
VRPAPARVVLVKLGLVHLMVGMAGGRILVALTIGGWS